MEIQRKIATELEKRVERLPLEILRRFQCATDVVVFGSFAVGMNHPGSDLDVLCIGEVKTHYKSREIELMILPEHDTYSEIWLGSELANHIKAFGVSLCGKPDWFSRAHVSERASSKKKTRVEAYLRAVNQYWAQLTPSSQRRFGIKIRRELQRLNYLEASRAVPPTKMLDVEFETRTWDSATLQTLLDCSAYETLRQRFPDILLI